MQNKWIISNPYTLDPRTVTFDPKIAHFNVAKSVAEMESLKHQIKQYGQTQPAYFRNGLLGDGVHRAKICTELGINLLAVDIDSNIPDNEYILLCNENTFTARNDSIAQKTIKALRLVDQFNYTDTEAAKIVALKDRRAISYARQIEASPLGKKLKVLTKLQNDEAVTIGTKTSKSLEVIRREIAKLEEAELLDTKLELKEPKIDYNEIINTEVGKEKFWDYVGHNSDIPYQTKIFVIGLINKVYQLKEK